MATVLHDPNPRRPGNRSVVYQITAPRTRKIGVASLDIDAELEAIRRDHIAYTKRVATRLKRISDARTLISRSILDLPVHDVLDGEVAA